MCSSSARHRARSEGHLNVSPKGLDTFRILGPTTVAYLDLTGSGIETVAHLRDNGRMTIMFCAFEGPPLIVRLYGRGRVVEPGDAEWDELLAAFPPQPGARSVIILEVDRITDSCGYAVPVYEYRKERTQLTDYARRKVAQAWSSTRPRRTGRASTDSTGWSGWMSTNE